MPKNLAALFLAVCLIAPLSSFATPASDVSIQKLLAVTHAKNLIASMTKQEETMIAQSIYRNANINKLTPAKKKIIENMANKTTALFHEELQWKKLEPMFVDIYRKSFTQDELDGMLKFYQSKAGQAVINKMPVVMNETMLVMRKKMQAMLPKIKKIEQDSLAQMKAAKSSN